MNEVLAGQLGAYVDQVRRQTGAAKVDIVGHSFGSLVSRWYVKYGGGTAAVAHWVSLGRPEPRHLHRLGLRPVGPGLPGHDPGSYVVKNLAAGDETPGAVAYATFWSDCDEVVNPDDSVPLAGAVNVAVGCLKHNDLLGDDATSAGVRAFLAS
ncbi:lipase family alpha/beta hydrolase [Streptomyces cirratus]